ncbi:carboxypeptidase-like regulatory domain-containing protein [Paraburkholderia terrae]|uniref:carboxypeptidase-like regulatory domain-containing protein n=1 Tax=Paraburkholderia terrae TaxID=311230 RepID=UPI0009DF54AF|nr:carboxypeptidase-like regulatory domain-containing protein [Paraburkholderia terrae]
MDDKEKSPPESSRGVVIKCVSWCEENLPFIVLVTLVVFIVVSSMSAYHLAVISEDHGERDGPYTILPFVVFVALSLAYSAWFISCFTGDPSPDKDRQSFRFAYAFTITAFVVLMIPVANPWQPDVVGPISLVRGCVLSPAGDESSVPGAIRCVRSEAGYLPPEVQSNYLRPSSSSTGTQGPGAGSDRPASDVAASAAAASDGMGSEASASQGKTGPSIRSYAACDKRRSARGPCIEGFSYPWLVTLGGFNGVVIRENRLLGEDTETSGKKIPDGATEPDASAPQVASSSASAAKANEARWFATRGSIVQGGFVVPFYVVLLALVGGAVSLARRIPEYQKRSAVGYVPTQKQSILTSIQVREVVVFQIMQLVSAPFIAVVAFYAIAPNTMSSAIGLAFLSGFSSELILLQIRGVIEGLQPHSTSSGNPANKPDPSASDGSSNAPVPPEGLSQTKTEQTMGDGSGSDAPSTAGFTVSGIVVGAAGEPVGGATISLVNSKATATTGVDGRFSLESVPSGDDHMSISKGELQASQDITVSDSPVDVGEIHLGAGGAG